MGLHEGPLVRGHCYIPMLVSKFFAIFPRDELVKKLGNAMDALDDAMTYLVRPSSRP